MSIYNILLDFLSLVQLFQDLLISSNKRITEILKLLFYFNFYSIPFYQEPRYKRELSLDIDPEDVLTILSLWENERRNG